MAFGTARPRVAPVGSYRVFDSRSTVATMGLKFWHLLVVGALAVSAVAAVVHIGRGATKETKTVASVATTMPAAIAKQAAAANVRSAIPSLEAFYAEHGTYSGADRRRAACDYDSGLAPTLKLGWVETGRYCLESTVEGQTASVTGPGGGSCSAAAKRPRSDAAAFDPRTPKSPPAADILRTRRRVRFHPRKRKPPLCGGSRGGRYWARTSDPQLVELVLSQLS